MTLFTTSVTEPRVNSANLKGTTVHTVLIGVVLQASGPDGTDEVMSFELADSWRPQVRLEALDINNFQHWSVRDVSKEALMGNSIRVRPPPGHFRFRVTTWVGGICTDTKESRMIFLPVGILES